MKIQHSGLAAALESAEDIQQQRQVICNAAYPESQGTHLSREVLGLGLGPVRREGARQRRARALGTVLVLAPKAMSSEDASSLRV